MSQVFRLIRVYPNGDSKISYRDAEGRASWEEYNRKWRFGCSQFVDGKCVYVGIGLNENQCKEIELQIQERFASTPMLPAEGIAPRVDRWGISPGAVDRWVGYPAEKDSHRYDVPDYSKESV